jgi:hypothetical protein
MIAALIQCAIALAIFLIVASIPFWNDFGRQLRHLGLAIFFGCFFLAIVASMLRAFLPVLLADWRFYVFLLVASPIAYLILDMRRRAMKRDRAAEQRPTQAKRRDGTAPPDPQGGI